MLKLASATTLNGAKYYLGKVKPQDNAGQRSSDLGGWDRLCKISWDAWQFTEPVACLHFSATVQPFA